MIYQRYNFYWQGFISWFLSLPLFGQILVAIGIVTIAVLLIIGVYYLLKGIGYLIYYICKGLYYLLKGFAIGVYKLFKWLYLEIVGKSEPDAEKIDENQSNITKQQLTPIVHYSTDQSESDIIKFCPECGVEFTQTMAYQLNKDGYVYCSFCGKKLDLATSINIES